VQSLCTECGILLAFAPFMARNNWLEGSTVLLTGSTRGIGRELAQQCAEAGANVVINGTHARTVDDVAASMRTHHQHVLGVQADVCDPEQAEQLVERTIEEYGQLDALFNIVGASGVRGGLLDTSPEQLQDIVARNIGSMIHATRYAMPHLEETKGRVIEYGLHFVSCCRSELRRVQRGKVWSTRSNGAITPRASKRQFYSCVSRTHTRR